MKKLSVICTVGTHKLCVRRAVVTVVAGGGGLVVGVRGPGRRVALGAAPVRGPHVGVVRRLHHLRVHLRVCVAGLVLGRRAVVAGTVPQRVKSCFCTYNKNLIFLCLFKVKRHK